MKTRHPEKVNKPVSPIKKKPEWIRSKFVLNNEFLWSKSAILLVNDISSFFKLDKSSFFSIYEKSPLSPDTRLNPKYKIKKTDINKK